MTKEKIITALQIVLKTEPAILFAYLFGSYAYGNTTQKSDIDVAVYLSTEKQEEFFNLRLLIMKKLSQALSCETDVVILNTAPPFLKYTVIREGILIYTREPEKRVDFELKTLNEYFDYKPIINLYRERLKIR